MTLNKIIGKNLQLHRKRLNLSQDAVAEFLKISREVISYYETGSREVPVEKLEQLADLYCVELADLMEENEELVNANVAFAFRADNLTPEDLNSISEFERVVKNYLKMQNIKKAND